MVVTEKKFESLEYLYQKLIKQFLIQNNIEEVICNNKTEHFFDNFQ